MEMVVNVEAYHLTLLLTEAGGDLGAGRQRFGQRRLIGLRLHSGHQLLPWGQVAG